MMVQVNPILGVSSHRVTQLSAESEAAIGRIALWAGHLERNLAELEQRLRGSASKSSQSASRSLRASRALIRNSELLESVDTQQMLKVLGEAKRLLDMRNAVIHAAVGTSMAPDAATFRARPKEPDRVLTAGELDEIARQLHEAGWRVFDCSMVVARVFGKARSS